MRHLAKALLSIGLILAAVVALAPISVAVPEWDDGRCGSPAVRYYAQETVDDENAQAVIDRCEAAAAERLVVAACLVGAGLLGGLLAMFGAWRREAADRRLKAARRRDREERSRAAQAEAARRARAVQAAEADALATPPRR